MISLAILLLISVPLSTCKREGLILTDEVKNQHSNLRSSLAKTMRWNLTYYFDEKMTREEFRTLMDVSPNFKRTMPPFRKSRWPEFDNLPLKFDSREKWPECADLIGKVYDQGPCAASYAVAATSAMTDRVCIHGFHNESKPILSAQNVLDCCENCRNGSVCQPNGGHPGMVWKFWYSEGIVTGGYLQSNEGTILDFDNLMQNFCRLDLHFSKRLSLKIRWVLFSSYERFCASATPTRKK